MDRRFSLAAALLILIGGGLFLWFNPEQAPGPMPTPVAPPAPSAPAAPAEPYVFAISWEPAFCEANSRKPECRSQTAGRADATGLSLHGLWPDDEYCGVATQQVSADRSGDWDALPAPQLSSATSRALDAAMPGTQSGLERHEWLKHGTCSGVDADHYFAREVTLLAAVNASAVGQLVRANIGESLTQGDIRAAFDDAFGRGAGNRVRIACERDGNRRLITELTIGLDGDVLGSGPLAPLIAAARGTSGGCDSGVVDRVGLQ